MDNRDAGVHVAVGVGLWALAGAIAVIGISIAAPSESWCAAWFWATCGAAALVALAGTVFVVGPFIGWNLPLTAATKAAQPALKISAVRLEGVSKRDVLVHVGFINEGGSDIERATLSVLVPDNATGIVRCDRDGNPVPVRNPTIDRTPEGTLIDPDTALPLPDQRGSLYWAESGITFDAHTAVPAYFKISFPTLPESLNLRVFVVSSALPGQMVFGQGTFTKLTERYSSE